VSTGTLNFITTTTTAGGQVETQRDWRSQGHWGAGPQIPRKNEKF